MSSFSAISAEKQWMRISLSSKLELVDVVTRITQGHARHLHTMERGAIDTGAITTAPRLALDANALLAYAKAHVPAVRKAGRKVHSLHISQFGHGQSNPTYKLQCVDVHGKDIKGLSFVLRKKPPGKILKSAHAIEREHAVQSALHRARTDDVPVPTMLSLCEDTSVVGTPFYLMSFVRGHVFTKPGLDHLPTPGHRRAVYDAMADTLGALHRLDPNRIGLSNFGGGKSKVASDKSNATYSKRQLERWAGQYALSLTQVNGDMKPEPAMVALIEWLRFNCPLNEPDGRLVHGDYRLDNLVRSF